MGSNQGNRATRQRYSSAISAQKLIATKWEFTLKSFSQFMMLSSLTGIKLPNVDSLNSKRRKMHWSCSVLARSLWVNGLFALKRVAVAKFFLERKILNQPVQSRQHQADLAAETIVSARTKAYRLSFVSFDKKNSDDSKLPLIQWWTYSVFQIIRIIFRSFYCESYADSIILSCIDIFLIYTLITMLNC